MLLYAWDLARFKGSMSLDVERAPDLDALLASILVRLMSQRIRIGLARGYVSENREMRGIRGRVDLQSSLKRSDYLRNSLHCRFQDLTIDVPKNQIVRTTLFWLHRSGRLGIKSEKTEMLRNQIRRLVRMMEGVSFVEVLPEGGRTMQFSRSESDYGVMLKICEVLSWGGMPTEAEGRHRHLAISRDETVLHMVFEKFVSNFFKLHLDGWDVAAQSSMNWPLERPHSYMPAMVPDLVLRDRRSGRIVVLDTKFTAASLLENQWGSQKFDPGHIFQLYGYLRSQEERSQAHRHAEGILLYPQARGTLNETIPIQGHAVRLCTLDLAKPWEEIAQSLTNLIVQGSSPAAIASSQYQ
jgi:5-methylcytosine-specific restriction enzyme subunit McrC